VVVVVVKLVALSPLVQVLLDKVIVAVLDLLAVIMVVVVAEVLEELAVHVMQKLQDTADQEHLMLYQDHYNIMQVAVEQV
jgi:hypothetical protein